jgi:hypothetical protein
MHPAFVAFQCARYNSSVRLKSAGFAASRVISCKPSTKVPELIVDNKTVSFAMRNLVYTAFPCQATIVGFAPQSAKETA